MIVLTNCQNPISENIKNHLLQNDYQYTIADQNMENIFQKNQVNSVIYFSSDFNGSYLESISSEVLKITKILECMKKYQVKQLIIQTTFIENQKKYFSVIEQILQDFSQENPEVIITILKCTEFTSNHPILTDMLKTAQQNNSIYHYGDEYSIYKTDDSEMDIIHVDDFAQAFMYSLQSQIKGVSEYEVGSGQPISTKRIVEIFNKTNGITFPVKHCEKKDNCTIANIEKMRNEIGWIPKKSIEDICREGWAMQQTQKINFIVS